MFTRRSCPRRQPHWSSSARSEFNTTTRTVLAELYFGGLIARIEGQRANGQRCQYFKLTDEGAKEAVETSLPVPRMSVFTPHDLQIFVDNPERELYGAELCRIDNLLKASSIYQALRRLEEAGWLTSREESVDPRAAGRLARCYYRITSHGLKEAREALAEAGRRIPRRPKSRS